jgi:3-hydroxybutyryl-CoA dehydrogenase
MNTRKGKEKPDRRIRPEVVVAGDAALAQPLGGLCMRAGFRVASYIPDYAGGERGFGLGALASGADIVVDTLDYPLDAKRALLDEIQEAVQPGALILSSGLGMTADETMLALGGYNVLVSFGLLELGARGRAVELAPASGADPEALPRAARFWSRLDVPIVEVEDSPGMVTPRILACVINEAAWAVGEGVADPEAIDTAMKLGASHPDGPLRRADRIGLHRVLAVLQNLQDYYGEERYRPAPALRRLVLQGRLGEEYGSGFYSYDRAPDHAE